MNWHSSEYLIPLVVDDLSELLWLHTSDPLPSIFQILRRSSTHHSTLNPISPSFYPSCTTSTRITSILGSTLLTQAVHLSELDLCVSVLDLLAQDQVMLLSLFSRGYF